MARQSFGPKNYDRTKTCMLESCERLARGRYCQAHAERVRKTGDPRESEPIIPRGPQLHGAPCEYCGDKGACTIKGGVYCQLHYHRMKRYGQPELPEFVSKTWVDCKGYIQLSYKGNRIMQHRLVMQQHLGRELTRDETVHHINGDRQDNRLENLELWSSRHPKGQRVTDKVAWAVEMLAQYAPERLAGEP